MFISDLTTRQQAIVDDVLRFSQMRAQQITRLHFYKNSEGSREQRMRDTMLKLYNRGYVGRLERDIGMGGAGSSGYIYQSPKSDRETPYPHALALVELYARLREAERAGLCKIGDDFYAETEGYYRNLRPDAYMIIRTPSGITEWNLEVDRDTEKRLIDRTKLGGYRRAFEEWTDEDGPVFPRGLYVVPNLRRLATIERRIKEQGVRELMQVCLMDDAVEVLTR